MRAIVASPARDGKPGGRAGGYPSGMPILRRTLLAAAAGATLAARRARARDDGGKPSLHVALLGDSIFDNKAYVGSEPAVIDQIGPALPAGARATLLAADGDCAGDVRGQLERLPAGATHLVVSAGGNDALGHEGMLTAPARSALEVFSDLARARDAFVRDYAEMLDAIVAAKRPAMVCTVYDPCFGETVRQRACVAALAVFNDAIVRLASSRGLPILDLRRICTAKEDYANPIEPSSKGGAKIAREIAAALAAHDFATRRTVLYPAAE